MEFLDPAAKKARTIRLFVGYALLAIVVALATTILVYQAQGFGYDTTKGVVRNGLLFIDSKPVSATITMDGQTLSDKTSARINLGEGEHSVKLSADKYRDWSKTFTIEGGSVEYLLYPKLFPKDIPVGITRVFAENPTWVSQSPDRNWLLLQQKAASPEITIINLLKTTEEPITVTLPSSIMVAKNGSFGTITPVEWSADNKHLLVLQTFADGSSAYLTIDRENPDKSTNVSAALNLIAGQTVALRDKKFDKFYVHTPSNGELRTADMKNGQATPFLTGIVAFKTHGDDMVTYVTYAGAKDGEANVAVLVDQKNKYPLRSIKRDPNNAYLLDQAKFDGDWYFVIGSPSDDLVRVYINPLKIKPNTSLQASPQTSLRVPQPKYVSFSDNTRFIAVQSGRNFAVYDAEEARTFRYESSLNIAAEQKVKWMDGHRFSVVTDSMVQVFDFDGTNLNSLAGSKVEYLPYFDRDYKVLYTLAARTDSKVGFQNAQLIVD